MQNSLMTRPEGHEAPVKRVRIDGAFVRFLTRTSREVNSAEHHTTPSQSGRISSPERNWGFLWSPPPPLPPGGSCCGFWVCLSGASLVGLSVSICSNGLPRRPSHFFFSAKSQRRSRACLPPHISLTHFGGWGREGWILAKEMEMAQGG